MTRAIALMSGGLDSMLAAKLIKEQGIDVIGMCFESCFFGSKKAVIMAEKIDIPLKIINFSEEHLKMVKNPKHGYGKNMNPCIDCHALMMNYAGKLLKELDADFIITGEVLNQRPMSQTLDSLEMVRRESGFEDYILRPLCAKNLTPTKMELEGKVDRSKLLDIKGRTRKAQVELAEKWGIVDYPGSAGGCSLTEPLYAVKLKDALKYNPDIEVKDIDILGYGRHMRLNDRVKLISSRNEDELKKIEQLANDGNYIFDTVKFNGSTVVLQGNADFDDIKWAAKICARYGKGKDEPEVDVKYKMKKDKEYNIIRVKPAYDEEIQKFFISNIY